jgi:phospholipase/carboxylesterase
MLVTEFIPARNKSQRLLVVLHGLGDSTAGYHWLPEALNLPWLNYVLVNAPDPYYGGYSWYDFASDLRPGVERSRKLLFKLLDDLPSKGFPVAETILFGFSQGCLMVVDVGLRYPHKLAGVVGISGYVFEPEELIREQSAAAPEQRLLITHGFEDPIVPFEPAREQFKMLKAAGLNLAWHEFHKAHTIAGELEMKVIRDFVERGYPPA